MEGGDGLKQLSLWAGGGGWLGKDVFTFKKANIRALNELLFWKKKKVQQPLLTLLTS